MILEKNKKYGTIKYRKSNNMDFDSVIEQCYALVDKCDKDYYGLSKKQRLDRELKSIIDNGLQQQIISVIQEGTSSTKNEINSLVLHLMIGLDFPNGEFTPIVDVYSDRLSPIDIDLDVSAEQRKDIIEFIKTRMQAYPIVAFNTLDTKSAIKSLGKAFGFPYSMMNSITKSIEAGIDTRVMDAVRSKYPRFFEDVTRLEGAINHCSIHASGIAVFDGNPEDHFISLRKAPRENTPIVDCDGDDLGTLGVMKVDLLGSATTDVIAEAERLAGIKLPPDEEIINDPETIAGFTSCNVSGIFQAGGDTNKHVFAVVKPTTFEEVADCISLARPGTKEQLPAYCSYSSDITNEVVLDLLKSTRGILLYQEQVLLIVKQLGDLTSSEAEQLRSAIAKKKSVEVIKPLQEKFLNNARAKIGADADALWEMISKHVAYSFNKSHAVSYAFQSFRQMYLKNNYPTEFWCAMLNACKPDEKYEYRYEISKAGIELLLPSVSNCTFRCDVPAPGYIQLPVTMINGIGSIDLDTNALSKCNDIAEALKLVSHLPKKIIMLMVKVGFFNSLCDDRGFISALVERHGQISLFEDPVHNPVSFNNYEIEKEMLGMWVTSHPMMNTGLTKIKDSLQYGGTEICGIVDKFNIMKDRNGNDMCFLTVADDTYFVKCIIFSNNMGKLDFTPYQGDIVRVVGKYNGGAFIVGNIERL